jgi:hypothetical protein
VFAVGTAFLPIEADKGETGLQTSAPTFYETTPAKALIADIAFLPRETLKKGPGMCARTG